MSGSAHLAATRLQLFYARQVHALNHGDFDAYGRTFTPGARFVLSGRAQSLCGAEAIAAHSRALARARAADGAVQRHHVTMTAVLAGPDGALRARSATLIVTTGPYGVPQLTASTECEDVFEEYPGGLQIAERRVLPDGAPRPATV
ncbi:nuclear transport factor 2 family protein [Streptomyces sp. NPDC014733]|uniref:nuclear transport factor 2 family protein n=1 Tax=Streptomyces sp. NPDC014733 TaxID=3364885 RepID=UPI0036F5A2C3